MCIHVGQPTGRGPGLGDTPGRFSEQRLEPLISAQVLQGFDAVGETKATIKPQRVHTSGYKWIETLLALCLGEALRGTTPQVEISLSSDPSGFSEVPGLGSTSVSSSTTPWRGKTRYQGISRWAALESWGSK